MSRRTRRRPSWNGFWIGILFFTLLYPSTVSAQAEEETKDFIYNAHDKRDPFWPLINAQGLIISYEKDLLITDLILEGIMLGEGGTSIAVINGEILRVGETMGVFEVKAIRSNMVILQKGQERYTLKLKKEE